jgi:nitrate/nitrite-specific signal transduction histidine kinase
MEECGAFNFMTWILKPLQRVISQAEAMGTGYFQVETIIPETAELKQLTLAMNQIANHKLVSSNLQNRA